MLAERARERHRGALMDDVRMHKRASINVSFDPKRGYVSSHYRAVARRLVQAEPTRAGAARTGRIAIPQCSAPLSHCDVVSLGWRHRSLPTAPIPRQSLGRKALFDVRRREFIKVLRRRRSDVAARGARAKQAMPVVGWLNASSPDGYRPMEARFLHLCRSTPKT